MQHVPIARQGLLTCSCHMGSSSLCSPHAKACAYRSLSLEQLITSSSFVHPIASCNTAVRELTRVSADGMSEDLCQQLMSIPGEEVATVGGNGVGTLCEN